MARYFTSDWHLNSSNIIKYAGRPFKTSEKMAEAYVRSCNQQAKDPNDTVIHVGDFFLKGFDRHDENAGHDKSLGFSAKHYLDQIAAQMVLVEGNHDASNVGHTLCKQMIIDLGPFKSTSISHYPSFEKGTWTLKGRDLEHLHIHLCGHVHDKWKWKIDHERFVLNINVGVDAWKQQIVAEKKLIGFISSLLHSDEFKAALRPEPAELSAGMAAPKWDDGLTDGSKDAWVEVGLSKRSDSSKRRREARHPQGFGDGTERHIVSIWRP